MSDNVYLLSWDCNGLEACINVSDIEKQAVWATLSNKEPPKLNQIVSAVLLRARYNSQRHYEVYTVSVDKSISEYDLRGLFEENPQGAAELIRERGNKVYSDRHDITKAKII